MTAIEIIVIIACVLFVTWVFGSMIYKRKKGGSGCSSCGSCPHKCDCDSKNNKGSKKIEKDLASRSDYHSKQ